MTNKEIIAKIEAAGHQVPGNLNRAKLEALAAEKGVSLEESPPEGEKPSEGEKPPEGEEPPEGGSGTTANPGDQSGDAGGSQDDEDEDEEDDRIEMIEATVRIRGRVIKVRPGPTGEGSQAICEEFPSIVGSGDDEREAIDDLFAAIEAMPPPEDNYDQNRLITPSMAVCAIAGDAAKVELPEGSQDPAE